MINQKNNFQKIYLWALMACLALMLSLISVPNAEALNGGSGNKESSFTGYRYLTDHTIQIWVDKNLPIANLDKAQFKIFEGTDVTGQELGISGVALGSGANITGVTGLSGGGSAVITTAEALVPGQTYTMVLNNTIKPNNGITLGQYNFRKDVVFSFAVPDTNGSPNNSTGTYSASVTPTFNSRPENGAINVSHEGKICFSLNIPAADVIAVKNGLVLKKNGVPLIYDPTINTTKDGDIYSPLVTDDHTFFYFPMVGGGTGYSYNLDTSCEYTLEIPEIVLVNGQILPARTITFNTSADILPARIGSAPTTAPSGNNLQISWSAPAAVVMSTTAEYPAGTTLAPAPTGYNIYASTDKYWNFTKLNNTPIAGTTYLASGLIPKATYYFRITPVNGTVEGGFSDPSMLSTYPAETPSFVSGTANADGTTAIITFSKAMADPVGKHAQFSVSVDGIMNPVTTAALNADATKIDLTLTNQVTSGTTVIVGYTKGTMEAADGGILQTFTGQAITVNGTVAIKDPATAPTNIYIPADVQNATLKVGDLLNPADADGKVISDPLPQLNVSAVTSISAIPVQVSIPAGATVTSVAADNWDGTINVPTVKDNNTVNVIPDSGKTAAVQKVIEVGYGNVPLTFSKAVKIVIPGQAGKYAGYYQGSTFTPISTVLTSTNQNDVDTELTTKGIQEGKQDSGSDLVIWTKHFTSFVTYTQALIPDDGGGNGSGNGSGANKDQPFTASFSTQSLNPAETVLQFDFTNGIMTDSMSGETLPGNIDSQIHVYVKNTITDVYYTSFVYTKTGSQMEPDVPKIRRLELTFENLQPSTVYVIEISSEFSANNGNKLSGTKKWEFTTSAAVVVPPAVKSISTTGGTVSDFGTTITIPATAFNSNIEVKIEKLSQISDLPMAVQSKLIGDVIEITKDKSGDFSKPIAITLSFDKTKVDQDKYDLSIYWLDEAAGKWVELSNVKVDMITGKVSGEVQHFTKFAVIATEKAAIPVMVVPSLNDIADHWATANIDKLIAIGAVSGYPDGSFKPDANISRAEFVTVLVKAFKLEARSGKFFNDTLNCWAKDYIATATAYGIINGYSDQLFGPNDLITREQMVVMVIKAAKLIPEAGAITFADSASISPWAREAIATSVNKGIIKGFTDNTVRPGNNASRGEAITVIANALN